MAHLAVIGNISRDHIVTPTSRSTVLGGAALHIAAAASAAGMPAAPVSIIGDDLAELPFTRPPLAALDWSAVRRATGQSLSFTLVYDQHGDLVDMTAEYGIATGLTAHALERIAAGVDDQYHVCCRTPLDIAPVLDALVSRDAEFSVDFIISSARDSISAAAAALPRSRLVVVNVDEFRLLSAIVPVESVPAIVVSDGPRPARLYRYGELAASADPPSATPTQVTGAGDTLAGTFLAGLASGLPDPTALRHAVTAATAHTVSPTTYPVS